MFRFAWLLVIFKLVFSRALFQNLVINWRGSPKSKMRQQYWRTKTASISLFNSQGLRILKWEHFIKSKLFCLASVEILIDCSLEFEISSSFLRRLNFGWFLPVKMYTSWCYQHGKACWIFLQIDCKIWLLSVHPLEEPLFPNAWVIGSGMFLARK